MAVGGDKLGSKNPAFLAPVFEKTTKKKHGKELTGLAVGGDKLGSKNPYELQHTLDKMPHLGTQIK